MHSCHAFVSCMYVSQEPVPPVHPPPGWRPKQQAKLFACMECVHAYIHAHMLTCSNVAGCQIGSFGLKTAFVQQCISSTGPARTCLNLIWGGVVFATPCGRCSGRLNTCMHICIYIICAMIFAFTSCMVVYAKVAHTEAMTVPDESMEPVGALRYFSCMVNLLYCKGACIHPWGSRMLTWHAHVWWGHACMCARMMKHVHVFHACLFAFCIILIFCDNGAHMHIACMKAEDAVEDEAPTTTPSYQAWSSMPSCMPLSFLIYIYIYI